MFAGQERIFPEVALLDPPGYELVVLIEYVGPVEKGRIYFKKGLGMQRCTQAKGKKENVKFHNCLNILKKK